MSIEKHEGELGHIINSATDWYVLENTVDTCLTNVCLGIRRKKLTTEEIRTKLPSSIALTIVTDEEKTYLAAKTSMAIENAMAAMSTDLIDRVHSIRHAIRPKTLESTIRVLLDDEDGNLIGGLEIVFCKGHPDVMVCILSEEELHVFSKACLKDATRAAEEYLENDPS